MLLSVARSDALTARLVRPAALAPALALLAVAWAGPLLEPATMPAVVPMTPLLTMFAAVALLLGFVAPHLPASYSHAVLFVLLSMGFVAVGAGVAMHAASPWDVAYVPLVTVAVGSLQLRKSWFAATVAVGWVTAVVAAYFGSLLSSVQATVGWGVLMVVATGLSVLALATRRRVSYTLLREWAESSEAAARDVLTGLLNRRGLRSATADVVEATWESGGSVSVAFIDVNGLKPVNDTFGHDAGDVLLRAVAQALRSSVRAQDWVARWGGDEFVVVSVNSQLPPHVLASRVAAALAKAPPPEGVDSWAPQVSVGQASAHAGEQTSLEELIESADEDMYAHRRAVREEQTWGR